VLLWFTTTYVGLVPTSARMRRPAIDISRGYLITIVWSTPGLS